MKVQLPTRSWALLIVVVSLLVCAGCTSNPSRPLSGQISPLTGTPNIATTRPTTIPPSLTPTPTQVTPTATPQPVATRIRFTATPTPINGYRDLPDGEYIVYYSGDHSVGVLSLDGQLQQTLIYGYSDISLSPDGRHLYFVPDRWHNPLLINLETMEQEELPFLKGCTHVSLSPDGKYLLGSCDKIDQSSEIYLFSRDGKQKTQLTFCYNNGLDCVAPAFTPDGRWISFYKGPWGAVQSPLIGFYLMDRTNMEFYGPFNISNDVIWAKNSKYLAGSWTGFLTLYEWTGQTLLQMRELDKVKSFMFGDWAWSEGSDRIAYSDGGTISIVDVKEGTTSVVKDFDRDVYVLGWIKIAR